MERAYRNLGYVLIALLPIFVAGFWIPYLSEFPQWQGENDEKKSRCRGGG
jgi:hypothetical protein